MKKKVLLSMLFVAMLALMTACDSNESSLTETTTETQVELAPTETTSQRDTVDFESADYKGKSFTILAYDLAFYHEYFFAEEQNGDRMNDAIIEREILTEEYLSVDIGNYIVPTHRDLAATVQKTASAGDDAYQLALPHCIRGVSDMLTTGSLYNWNDLPYIDFTKEYYNHNFNDALSLGDKQFYAVSDYMIANPSCILFNKDLITNYNLDNPYELVYEGSWTFDKMYDMAKQVTLDLNGDSVMDINDQYGITGEGNWLLNCIPYACEIFLAEKTGDSFKVSYYSEKTITVLEKFHQALNSDKSMFLWPYLAVKDPATQVAMDSGRALFQLYELYAIYNFRDSDVDFGILPFPKYDEAQDNYYTNDWGSLMCIPASVGEPEMAAKVIDYLSFISQDTTVPAYYDVTLGSKLSKDEDSVAMMDIIFENIVYDAGMNYFAFGDNMYYLFYTPELLVRLNQSTDFASWYTKYGDGAQAEIDKFMDSLPD